MWISEDLINDIIWSIIIIGGMAWIVELWCDCIDGKREFKKQLQAEKAAKK